MAKVEIFSDIDKQEAINAVTNTKLFHFFGSKDTAERFVSAYMNSFVDDETGVYGFTEPESTVKGCSACCDGSEDSTEEAEEAPAEDSTEEAEEAPAED